MIMADGAEEGKIFVGGLSWETNEEKLRNYFGEFGNVTECLVMKNPETGKSRGFGFVSFLEPNSVQKVLDVSNHQLDGRTIDPKECNPRTASAKFHKDSNNKQANLSKIFLGGLPPNITETNLKEFFSKYGKVTEVIIMFDQEKKKSRGFGFLLFDNEDSINKVVSEHFVTINGKQVEVKRAEPQPNKSGTPIQNGSPHHHGGMISGQPSIPVAGIVPGTGIPTMPYFLTPPPPPQSWPQALWPQTPVAPSPSMMNGGISNISGNNFHQTSPVVAAANSIAWNPVTAAAAAAAIAATAATGPPTAATNWAPYGSYPTFPHGWPIPIPTGNVNMPSLYGGNLPPSSTTPIPTPIVSMQQQQPPPSITPHQQHHHPAMIPSPSVIGHTFQQQQHQPPQQITNFLPPTSPIHHNNNMIPMMNPHYHQANGGNSTISTAVSTAIIPNAIGQTSIGNYHHETNSYSVSQTHQQQPVGGMNIANIYRPPPTISTDTNYQYPLPVTLNNNNTHQQQQYHHNPVAAIANSMNVTVPSSSSSAQSIPSVSSDYIISGNGNGSGPITTMIKSPNMISGVINPINAYNNQQQQQQSFHGSRMNLQSQSQQQQQQSSTMQNQSYHPYRRS